LVCGVSSCWEIVREDPVEGVFCWSRESGVRHGEGQSIIGDSVVLCERLQKRHACVFGELLELK
jgi:hypothetical protein